MTAENTRIVRVLRLALDRGTISTADVRRLLNTNVHDAGRLLYRLRLDGLLEPVDETFGQGHRVTNRLTDAGRERLCGRVCSPPLAQPDFGPLLAAFGR